ncbi:MAG: hypothetical protein ACKO0Z_02310 [Betaproteobacteria bacterium]
MKCPHCGFEIVPYPAAKERAEKFGGKPSDYTNMFPAHAACTIIKQYTIPKRPQLLNHTEQLRIKLNLQPQYRKEFRVADLHKLKVNFD